MPSVFRRRRRRCGVLAGATVRCTEAGLRVGEELFPERVEEEKDRSLTDTEDLYHLTNVVSTDEQ